MLNAATLPLVVLLGCNALAPYSPGPCAFAELEACQRRGDALAAEFRLPDPMICQIQVAGGGRPA